MGEVYEARDPRLDRLVALKVLSADVAKDPDRLARFEREARAVAALNHPNIVTLYGIEESDGVRFLAMERIQGQPLSSLIEPGGLPLKKILEWAIPIADALAAAHAHGVVHRDLKPGNVMINEEGRPKILDFGLARVSAPSSPPIRGEATTEALTAQGTVFGTVPYMSPEQLRGERADARADLFAFGAVLYEMAAGRRPFTGATGAEVAAAILTKDPVPLESVRTDLSAAFVRIVSHCLDKDPRQRIESAADLRHELSDLAEELRTRLDSLAPATPDAQPAGKRRLVSIVALAAVLLAVAGAALKLSSRIKTSQFSSAAKQPLRIVVLPFENLGGPDDGYFASGMTEEITSRLANVRNLAVISRTSATQYDRKGKTVEQIGKDLGVAYVLEGSVRWDRGGGGAGRVRITPQLIRVSDDSHLWSERYDRQLADVFAIQGDVADGVVRALNLTLAPAESTALRQLPTHDLEAYDSYLRALELEKRVQQRSAIAKQIELASQAVERDPQFAEALALLAKARINNYWFYFDRRASELERARAEAERSVALRPDSAETHWALGYYLYQGRLDYEAALVEIRKALVLQPNNARVHAVIGYIRRRQGRMEEAEAGIRKAISCDPMDGYTWAMLAQTQTLSHNYAEAIRSDEMAASLNPNDPTMLCYVAWANVLWRGDVARAEQLLEKAAGIPALDDPHRIVDGFFVRVRLMARDWEGALRRLNTSPEEPEPGQSRYVPTSLRRAQVLSYMGRRDLARKSYEEARRHLMAEVLEMPEDARFHSSLGIALAGLGRDTEAVREGERGVALMPLSRDAFRGIPRLEDLALIYTMVGNQEAALQQLDYLLSHPSWISVPLLRLDPCWDPLRKNPKFAALLAKHEVKP